MLRRPARLTTPTVLCLLLVGVATLSATAGCGPAGQPLPKAVARRTAPPLHVVVSAYPLAQMVSYIGGKAVVVLDLAPVGTQPQGLALTASRQAAMRSAQLVIDVGDRYQPALEVAAAAARNHLAVLPAISKQTRPYEFWLDPYLMAKAAAVISKTMTAADPVEREQFQNADMDFQSVAASIEADFESTFSQCTRDEFVTADDAFGRMAASFDLVDVAVTTAGVDKAVATVDQNGLPAVFSEAGAPEGSVQRVASAARVDVKSLDPLEIAPGLSTTPLSYFAVMEEDLTALEGPLACDTSDNFS